MPRTKLKSKIKKKSDSIVAKKTGQEVNKKSCSDNVKANKGKQGSSSAKPRQKNTEEKRQNTSEEQPGTSSRLKIPVLAAQETPHKSPKKDSKRKVINGSRRGLSRKRVKRDSENEATCGKSPKMAKNETSLEKVQDGKSSDSARHVLKRKDLTAALALKSCQNSSDESSDNGSDWEEVPMCPLSFKPIDETEESSQKKDVIQIVIKKDDHEHQYKTFDIEGERRRAKNRKKKVIQSYVHSVSLMCYVHRGRSIDFVLLRDSLLALGLSLLPDGLSVPKRFQLSFLEKFIALVKRSFKLENKIVNHDDYSITGLEEHLTKQFLGHYAYNKDHLVFIAIVLLRSMGFAVRLIYSLQPVPLKIDSSELERPKGEAKRGRKPKKLEEKEMSEETDDSDESEISEILLVKKKKIAQSKKKSPCSNNQSADETKVKRPFKYRESHKDQNFWFEVYEQEIEKWVCVDLDSSQYFCESLCAKKATPPVHYVLAFNGGYVTDLTRKYAHDWLYSSMRTKRVAEDWWTVALNPLTEPASIRTKLEEEDLDDKVLNSPIPKSLNDINNHPLYVAPCHLKKFEVIYPEDLRPLGYRGSIPIYDRENVHTVMSDKKWILQGKTIKAGENPCKIVSGRPAYDKLLRRMVPRDPVHLFGSWQVENYVPPVAKDGKIPRNQYGNVELFVPEMIPKGTVHLQLPGLMRVTKKLGIDCAPAITGFEFNRGSSHPIYDGFIICQEQMELVMDAWQADQLEQERRSKERRFQRARKNWRWLFRLWKNHKRLQSYRNITSTERIRFEDLDPSKREVM